MPTASSGPAPAVGDESGTARISVTADPGRSSGSPARERPVRELLRDGTYLRYWLAVVVSFLGDAMTRVTLIYVAVTLTGVPEVITALVVIAQLLPSGVLGALAGTLADRFPKRTMLIGADLARTLIVLAMIPALDSAWLLVVLIGLEGTGRTVFETARIAAVPQIVGRHSIPAAVALFQATAHTVNLLGPALGGLLLAIGKPSVVLIANAATFVVSAALLGSMAVLRETQPRARTAEPYWRATLDGARQVLRIPSLRFLALFLVPVSLVLGLFTTNFNVQLLAGFELSAGWYGLAHAGFAGGAVLAALLGPRLVRRYTGPIVPLIGSVALFGVTLALLAPTGWLTDRFGLPTVLAWCLLVGLGSSLFQAPMANTMLADLPAELRGRGVGLINMIMVNCMVLGVAVGSLVALLVGVANSILVASGVLLVTAVGTAGRQVRSAVFRPARCSGPTQADGPAR